MAHPLFGSAERVYGNGGLLSDVCHGPAGLLNVRQPDGSLVLAGRPATGFANALKSG